MSLDTLSRNGEHVEMPPAIEVAGTKLLASIDIVVTPEQPISESSQISLVGVPFWSGEMFVDLCLDERPAVDQQFANRVDDGGIEAFGVDLDVAQAGQQVGGVRAHVRRQ